MSEALLITLLKPGKDPSECGSYRPLSLINIDAKILAKILANRIQPLLSNLVLPDQAGFMPTRSTTHNIRTIFALYHQLDPDMPAAAALLDAAKAFDSVEWDFLFITLQKMGFPEPFLKWISLLYLAPKAQIRINGYTSNPIEITRYQTRLPIISNAFCTDTRTHSLQNSTNTLQFELRPIGISLYADDMVLYTTHPDRHLNPLIREYVRYEQYARLHINWDMSVVIPLTECTIEPELDYPLSWQMDPIKYLGIWVHRDPTLVISENYGKALLRLEEQVDKWIKMPLSMADRIALQK